MAIDAQTILNMLELDLITLFSSLGFFAFVAGHAAGTTIAITRKFTHAAT